MAIERTFSIIKPDATARNLTGAINAVIEKAGLRIVAQKRVRWTRAQAEKFYEFVISNEGQKIIAEFGKQQYGESLYYPAVIKDPK